MPAQIDKHKLDPNIFKGSINPTLFQRVDGTWMFRQLAEQGERRYESIVIGKVSKEEAIDRAPAAFLKLRDRPSKKRYKGLYDQGYVPAIDWEHYKLPSSGIYFITNDWDSIKIGRSVDFKKRLMTHQGSNPARLHVVMLLPVEEVDQPTVERELHKKFMDCCRNNEWFWNVPSLQEHIETLQHQHNFVPFIFGKRPKNWFL
jgi:hypothetical protein